MRRWLQKQTDKIREKRHQRKVESQNLLKARYQIFRSLLASNNRAIDCLTEITIQLRLQSDLGTLHRLINNLISETAEMVDRLQHLSGGKYRNLFGAHRNIADHILKKLEKLPAGGDVPFAVDLAGIHGFLKGQTGNKAATLSALKKNKDFHVPDGFVVTLAGCQYFLEHAGLSLQLVQVLAANKADREMNISPAAAQKMQQLIREAIIPVRLSEEIVAKARPFFDKKRAVAVRSSSISEDGQKHSFAGQFSSVLNVRNGEQLLQAFKDVVASNFNFRSIAYRLNAGLDPLRFDMAALCLEMIEAKSAGIMLTRSPQNPGSGMMLISAVPGLGEAAVSGSAASDLYVIDREGNVDWDLSTISSKEKLLACENDGGVFWKEVAPEDREKPVLSQDLLRVLAGFGKKMEESAGMPQDIEWAVDQDDRPLILQARPLTFLGGDVETGPEKSGSVMQGIIASGGRATGKVLMVKNRRDFEQVLQEPVVLVMHQSFVDAVNLLERAAAVLVDLGSPADHLACVAREHEKPMICGLKNAEKFVESGQWITVDGSHGKVYPATPEEIESAQESWNNAPSKTEPAKIELPASHHELQELITALHLTDAYGPTFSILECRSLHDIIRFAHEKAVLAMFDAGDEILEGNMGTVHTVDAPVPFFVSVVDMGGGLTVDGQKKRRISAESVISRPFQALWKGITTPGLSWGPPPGGAPMGSVVSSWLTDQKSERPLGMPNYAIVSRDYCNLNARMDFHFIMIDAVCGIEPRSNHIKFRFKGGGTSLERRRRRALCIGEIFERQGFLVDVREDLVNTSLQGASKEAIEEKLVMVGRILGFTRLLDAAMGDDRMIQRVARAFEEADYGLSNILAFKKDQA